MNHAFFAWIVKDRKSHLKKKKKSQDISKCKLNDDAGIVGIYKHILFIFLLLLMKKNYCYLFIIFLNNVSIINLIIIISFEKTNCKSLLGEWLERPSAVPRVSCSIANVCKNFLISKFNISPVYICDT